MAEFSTFMVNTRAFAAEYTELPNDAVARSEWAKQLVTDTGQHFFPGIDTLQQHVSGLVDFILEDVHGLTHASSKQLRNLHVVIREGLAPIFQRQKMEKESNTAPWRYSTNQAAA